MNIFAHICKKGHKVVSFILYWLTLLHEVCHVLITYAFAKDKNVKPIIVIGNYDACVGHKPNRSIFSFDVFYYDEFTLKKYLSSGNKGITLYPAYYDFSKLQIRLCAAVGWIFDFIFTLKLTIIFRILLILYCNWLNNKFLEINLNLNPIIILLPLFRLGIILFIYNFVFKTSDFKTTFNPNSFRTKSVKNKYKKLIKSQSIVP